MILCAWLAIRVQDMQRTKFFLDEDDPAHIVRGVVTCSKSGEPINLFMPAKGVLVYIQWLQEHVALLERTGLEKGGIAFPDWDGPWGSRSNLAKARRLVESSTAAPDAIRSIFAYLLALTPLGWPKGKLGQLGVKGHSMHVSLADNTRTIGRNPTFPFELDRAAARGFSRDDRRELGHWAGEGNGRASWRGAMDLVYSRGEGRIGEEARQLAVRGRLIRIISAA
jgi:hypothetical protein